MTITSNSVANQALAMAGDNIPPVSGYAPTFDNSTAGVALASLYAPCVRTVARQFGFDFSRNVATLGLSGNVAPVGWAFEYVYPTNGVEVWQLQPSTIADANNPLPQNWTVGNTLVGGTQAKVIWSNLASAEAVFNNAPQESVWDPTFQEAVVRLLASELAMALFGKPDSAEQLLTSGAAFEQISEGRMG